ncbi:MAG: TonB-dependent receptor [Bacteroidota bacterium]|nr:TonB-dependent receptor [Bacteroidota bacterium]
MQRNWRRQQFTRDGANANSNGVVWGDSNLTDGSSIFMSNKADWRNRQYQVGGIETKLLINHNTFGVENRAKIGARYLRERANEQFIQTAKPNGWGGNMRDNEVRDGNAISFFAINNTKITNKLSAEYGIRLENYDYQRRIYRGRFNVGGNTVTADTLVSFTRNSFAILPGLGINYNLSDNATIFAGVHKGYAPPQVKSAITPSGVASQIDKEESVNYELGARFATADYLNFSATLFYMDFDNQVIPVNTAINPSGVASGGKTKHKGIEVDVNFDVARALGSEQSVSLGGNFTYSQAKFAGNDVIQNFLPYSPEYIINGYVSADFTNGLGVSVFGNYVSEQFNDRNNTVIPTPNGLVGRIDSRFVLDATAYYQFKNTGLRLSVSAKNLLNEKYIVSRNPQGIRVGLERFITAGFDFTF